MQNNSVHHYVTPLLIQPFLLSVGLCGLNLRLMCCENRSSWWLLLHRYRVDTDQLPLPPTSFCLIGKDQPNRVLHLRIFKKRNTLAIFRPVFRLHAYKSVLSLRTHVSQTSTSSYLQLVSAVYIKHFPTKSPSLVFYLPSISKCLRHLASSCAWETGVHGEWRGCEIL